MDFEKLRQQIFLGFRDAIREMEFVRQHFFAVFAISRGACHIMEENKNEKKKIHLKFIPQTPKRIKQNIILALGLIFVAVGIIFTATNYSSAESVNMLPAIFTIFIGALFLFFGMGFLQSSFMIFIGLMIFLLGIPFLLKVLEIIRLEPMRMIPYAMICAGISLFVAGLYKFRRIRSSYIFTSSMLIVLGIFFWLFSSGVLKLSLTTFVSRWLPLLVLFLGVILVVVFYVQQIRKKDFPYLQDEKDDSLDDGSL